MQVIFSSPVVVLGCCLSASFCCLAEDYFPGIIWCPLLHLLFLNNRNISFLNVSSAPVSPGCCYLCSSSLPLQAVNSAHPGTSCKAAVPNLRVIDFCFFIVCLMCAAQWDAHLACNTLLSLWCSKTGSLDFHIMFNDTWILSTKGPIPRCANRCISNQIHTKKGRNILFHLGNVIKVLLLQLTSPHWPNYLGLFPFGGVCYC